MSRDPVPSSRESSTEEAASAPLPVGLAVVAWLVPGAGHALLGQFSKAAIFFGVLTGMFAFGCGLEGRLFPLASDEWLVVLAGAAQWGAGLPRIVAGLAGAGEGTVTAVTYEYGNTFLMASGLLNMLVVLNALDVARVRRRA